MSSRYDILSNDDKDSMRHLVDRGLLGRPWIRKTIDTKSPTAVDKAKILFALQYGLSEYYNLKTPGQVLHNATIDMVNKLGLRQKIEKYIMVDVPELPGIDMLYITRRMFPEKFREDEESYIKTNAQNYYEKILDGTAISKGYYNRKEGGIGRKRALWHLEVHLKQYQSFEEAYNAFAGGDVLIRLKNAKLLTAYKATGFEYPLDYLHECIKNYEDHTDEHELLYQKLRFKLMTVEEEKRRKDLNL